MPPEDWEHISFPTNLQQAQDLGTIVPVCFSLMHVGALPDKHTHTQCACLCLAGNVLSTFQQEYYLRTILCHMCFYMFLQAFAIPGTGFANLCECVRKSLRGVKQIAHPSFSFILWLSLHHTLTHLHHLSLSVSLSHVDSGWGIVWAATWFSSQHCVQHPWRRPLVFHQPGSCTQIQGTAAPQSSPNLRCAHTQSMLQMNLPRVSAFVSVCLWCAYIRCFGHGYCDGSLKAACCSFRHG